MLAAFSMISTAISTMMKLRRISTPIKPVANRIALTATYALKGTMPSLIRGRRRLRQHDGADDRTQEKDPDDLEGEQVIAKHLDPDRITGPILEHRLRRCVAFRPAERRPQDQHQHLPHDRDRREQDHGMAGM